MGTGIKYLGEDGQVDRFERTEDNPQITGLREALRRHPSAERASSDDPKNPPSSSLTAGTEDDTSEADQVSRPSTSAALVIDDVDKFGDQAPDDEHDPDDDLTPQQKAARTRAANKAKAEAEEAAASADGDPEDEDGDEPELDDDGNPVEPTE